jgi:hypothetical protein
VAKARDKQVMRKSFIFIQHYGLGDKLKFCGDDRDSDERFGLRLEVL